MLFGFHVEQMLYFGMKLLWWADAAPSLWETNVNLKMDVCDEGKAKDESHDASVSVICAACGSTSLCSHFPV